MLEPRATPNKECQALLTNIYNFKLYVRSLK